MRKILHRIPFFLPALIAGLLALSFGPAEARTVRSCSLDLVFEIERRGPDYDELSEEERNALDRLWAGSLTFSASAPGVSHNLARMRASKKAEACIDNFWSGDHCRSRASGSSYGEAYDTASTITGLMKQSICDSLRARALMDDGGDPARIARETIGQPFTGRLVGIIDGDRCCKNSSRGCPYAYGDTRASPFAIFDPQGKTGEVIWPDAAFGTMCPARILPVPIPLGD